MSRSRNGKHLKLEHVSHEQLTERRIGIVMNVYRIAGLIALSLGVAKAQSTSSLTGVVTDPSGAVVPGATIVVVNSETNLTRTATTDSEGRYSFQQMQPS